MHFFWTLNAYTYTSILQDKIHTRWARRRPDFMSMHSILLVMAGGQWAASRPRHRRYRRRRAIGAPTWMPAAAPVDSTTGGHHHHNNALEQCIPPLSGCSRKEGISVLNFHEPYALVKFHKIHATIQIELIWKLVCKWSATLQPNMKMICNSAPQKNQAADGTEMPSSEISWPCQQKIKDFLLSNLWQVTVFIRRITRDTSYLTSKNLSISKYRTKSWKWILQSHS